jgi:uncharacterized protein YegL
MSSETYSPFRRLPIYLLLDTSWSMRGEPIRAVNNGLKLLGEALRKNPMAVETAFISIIEYKTEAMQILPLTEVLLYTPPELKAGGWSNMGAALTLLNECLEKEVKENDIEKEQKGDYKPLVFLMTDGHPTDKWEKAVQNLRERKKVKISSFIALGCGPKADLEVLKKVADVTLAMKDVTPEVILEFFRWISQTIGTASRVASQSGGGEVFLPPPPEFIVVVS